MQCYKMDLFIRESHFISCRSKKMALPLATESHTPLLLYLGRKRARMYSIQWPNSHAFHIPYILLI